MRTHRVVFKEPMLLVSCSTLPEGPQWSYELKLDGYRAIAIKSRDGVQLKSRNGNSFNGKYPAIVAALASMPDETVIDGEVVALDEAGRPSFNALQNGASAAVLCYYVFDVMMLRSRDVMGEQLVKRRDLLTREVMPVLTEPVRETARFDVQLADLVAAVRAQGLEGIVAKRLDSLYEPGARSGAWMKMRLNQSGEFVIGGYTAGGRTFDAVVIGRNEGDRLLYVARTRPRARQSRTRRPDIELYGALRPRSEVISRLPPRRRGIRPDFRNTRSHPRTSLSIRRRTN